MTKKSGPIYRGRLAEPLDWFPGPPDLAAEADQQFLQGVCDAACEKMFLLLDHYKIPHDREDRWYLLSVNLATDHVPGFQIAAKKGRKQKWHPLLDAAVRIEVDRYIHQNPKHSITSVSHKVAKIPYVGGDRWWQQKAWRGYSASLFPSKPGINRHCAGASSA